MDDAGAGETSRRRVLEATGTAILTPFLATQSRATATQTPDNTSAIAPPDLESNPVYAQPGGNAGQQGSLQGRTTPRQIADVETLVTQEEILDEAESIDNQDPHLDRIPAINAQGVLAAPGYEVAVTNTPDTDPQIIDTKGRNCTPVIPDQQPIVGDETKNRRIKPETGETIASRDKNNEVLNSLMHQNSETTAYQAIGGGIGELDTQNMQIIEKYTKQLGKSPAVYGHIPIDNNHMIVNADHVIRKRSLDPDQRLGYNNNDKKYFQDPISTDGNILAAAEADYNDGEQILKILDPETDDVEELAATEQSIGSIEAPLNIVDEGTDEYAIYGVTEDAEAFEAIYDDQAETVEIEWTEQIVGGGEGRNTVVWGDALIVGTTQKISVRNRTDGSLEFGTDQAGGYVSMPGPDDEIYVAGADGLFRLSMQLPTDPDGDGHYEDVDGDGDVDIFDVQEFYTDVTDGHPPDSQQFDFDDDGDIDVFDIQTLYQMVRQSS